jgi:hypothetical protein
MQTEYNRTSVLPQATNCDDRAQPGNTSFYLNEAKKSCAQFKLSLRRLQCCFSSQRTRSALDPICAGLDSALSSLERLDFGRAPGAAR